ncbi:MAG: GTP 3',8-cyclase MoaA [Actinomycetota bacterium]|nr:GTP 3',8-cyclase MoaA [Actinomycetota bacterium]
MLRDAHDRELRDLRVSVTDRCNFRCAYCMPRDVYDRDHVYLPRDEILTFEEIERLVRLFAGLGVEKVRLTGGEPLLRHDLDDLVAKVAAVEGISDVAMTTNGSTLARHASALADAGLDRVTVSLDAVDDTSFRGAADVDFPVARVLEGIDAAKDAGLTPVKINTVVRRGLNDETIVDIAGAFRGTGHIVRFIEYMDVGSSNDWKMKDVVTADQILATIASEWPLDPIDPNYPGEVVNRWRYRDGQGEIGVIASVSKPFCGECTRLRLSADGSIYTCLFATQGTDLRDPLRSGATNEELVELITAVWQARSDRYSEERTGVSLGLPKVEMSYIGG